MLSVGNSTADIGFLFWGVCRDLWTLECWLSFLPCVAAMLGLRLHEQGEPISLLIGRLNFYAFCIAPGLFLAYQAPRRPAASLVSGLGGAGPDREMWGACGWGVQ